MPAVVPARIVVDWKALPVVQARRIGDCLADPRPAERAVLRVPRPDVDVDEVEFALDFTSRRHNRAPARRHDGSVDGRGCLDIRYAHPLTHVLDDVGKGAARRNAARDRLSHLGDRRTKDRDDVTDLAVDDGI